MTAMGADRRKVVVILHGAGGCHDILGDDAVSDTLKGPPGHGPPGDVLRYLQDEGWQVVASYGAGEFAHHVLQEPAGGLSLPSFRGHLDRATMRQGDPDGTNEEEEDGPAKAETKVHA